MDSSSYFHARYLVYNRRCCIPGSRTASHICMQVPGIQQKVLHAWLLNSSHICMQVPGTQQKVLHAWLMDSSSYLHASTWYTTEGTACLAYGQLLNIACKYLVYNIRCCMSDLWIAPQDCMQVPGIQQKVLHAWLMDSSSILHASTWYTTKGAACLALEQLVNIACKYLVYNRRCWMPGSWTDPQYCMQVPGIQQKVLHAWLMDSSSILHASTWYTTEGAACLAYGQLLNIACKYLVYNRRCCMSSSWTARQYCMQVPGIQQKVLNDWLMDRSSVLHAGTWYTAKGAACLAHGELLTFSALSPGFHSHASTPVNKN